MNVTLSILFTGWEIYDFIFSLLFAQIKGRREKIKEVGREEREGSEEGEKVSSN